MKKKKKNKIIIEDYLYDTYNNIIKINDKNKDILDYLNQIKQQLDSTVFYHHDITETYDNNIDFIYDYINIDYVYYKV